MNNYSDHEEYLRNAILNTNESQNLKKSKKTLSSQYFKDLKQELLIKYENKRI